MTREYLADSSVWARLAKPAVRDRLDPLIEAGLIYTCSVVDFEVGRTARSAAEYGEIMSSRRAAIPWLPEPDDLFRDVLLVQSGLAAHGFHRKPGLPDVLIALTAAMHQISVLHYDHDFDRISSITGQDVEWVLAPGTVD